VTFLIFAQKELLIDVATAPTSALALGNDPLLSATLSFLSSRGQPSCPDVAVEGSAVRHSCAPLLPAHNLHPSSPNPHGNTNLSVVIPGFQEWSAEPQIARLRLSEALRRYIANRGLHSAESKSLSRAESTDPGNTWGADALWSFPAANYTGRQKSHSSRDDKGEGRVSIWDGAPFDGYRRKRGTDVSL
jgi:hypothetical protein